MTEYRRKAKALFSRLVSISQSGVPDIFSPKPEAVPGRKKPTRFTLSRMREWKGKVQEEIAPFTHGHVPLWDTAQVGNNEGPLLAWGFFSRTGDYLRFGANEDVAFEGTCHDTNVLGSAHTTKESGEVHHFSFHDTTHDRTRGGCTDARTWMGRNILNSTVIIVEEWDYSWFWFSSFYFSALPTISIINMYYFIFLYLLF